MFSDFRMSADRAFGFLLFSGVIVLTVSKQTGVFSRLNWISSIYKPKDRNGPNGDFVIGKNGKNSRWKEFVSSRDAEEAELRCEVEVQNETGEMLVFCWIMPSGKLRNFTPIHDGSIKDNSISNRHVESTFIYHAFVCMKKSRRSPKTLEEVSDEVHPSAIHSKLIFYLCEYEPSFLTYFFLNNCLSYAGFRIRLSPHSSRLPT